jgi:hypothetical protein
MISLQRLIQLLTDLNRRNSAHTAGDSSQAESKEPDASTPIIIDARVSGYKGEPVRLRAVCNPKSGRVKIRKEAAYLAEGEPLEPQTVIVTDSPSHFDHWQLAFHEDQHLADAVKSFFELQRAKKVSHETNLIKYFPQSILELRKIDKGGSVWEFNSELTTNAHVAYLLAVWAARRITLTTSITYQIDDDAGADFDDPMMPFSTSDDD